MTKDRLIAFTDAVLAIIMTILVLELDKPADPTIQAFWELRQNFFAYIVSFFWLGALWDGLATVWKNVEKISSKIVWSNLLLLFFSSLIPYMTSLVSQYFNNHLIQGLYGVVIIMTTVCNYIITKFLEKENYNNSLFMDTARTFRKILIPDIIIKVIALFLALAVWAPIMSIGVSLAAIYTVVTHLLNVRR